ncbi:MAG: hydroxylamine oxidase [Nitrospirae bacterium]|nr:MAG: hydroxylamine oxidase [Nitrospirota bacterium]
MKLRAFLAVCSIAAVLALAGFAGSADQKPSQALAKISPETESCIGCHEQFTPGIVADWRKSRHAVTLPADALRKPALQRRVSAQSVPPQLGGVVVGCYECHSLNLARHKDAFDHNGFRIQVVVSPNDCSTCHPVEATQYGDTKKAHAIKNLMDNPVYHTLVSTITGIKKFEKGKISSQAPSDKTLHETCLGCHGTLVEAKGLRKVNTAMGELEVPKLTNWPNQGVGRMNPDGSIGACSACHPRHSFSIEIARKPHTCGQCHLEPDVPAYNVYKESKHGNIYESKKHTWNFSSVPWVVGKDFSAPTCATCHNSLVTSPSGEVIAERTHNFSDRLWVRIFGLPYAHPQPKSGNTTIIRNADGLPLPTTFTNIPASSYLIDKAEQDKRFAKMKGVCTSCHTTAWTMGHFAKLDNTIQETNAMTLTATQILVEAWKRGVEDKKNPFDETIEQLWLRHWLFYGNSIRYASAMSGAPDYAAFKNGWWELLLNTTAMKDTLDYKTMLKKGRK